MRIALLEDDSEQSELIFYWLKDIGHECKVFNKSKDIIRELGRETFDLLILDWNVPDISGLNVLKWVRSHIETAIPVIFVTARDAEEDTVAALNAGADDYMNKPLKKAELIARINALSRRFLPPKQDNGEVTFIPYVLYPALQTISINDKTFELTTKEFDLAYFLFRNEGHVISRGHMLESVWGSTSDLNTRTVDTHVSRVRTKLMLKGEHGWILRSVYQHGYRLEKIEKTI